MTKPAKKPSPALRPEPETPLEPDAVWDLIDKAPTQPASAYFAHKTVQLVRERQERKSWWQRLLTPVPLAGLAAATAAIALAISMSFPSDQGGNVASFGGEQADAIQEALETEMLIAAADNPADFSDQELVYLLGF